MSIRGRLALVAFGLAVAGPLQAQSAPSRDGFFIGLGIGGGGGEVSGNSDAEVGGGWLTIGGTLSPKLRLAGDIQGYAVGPSEDELVGTTTLAALWYPSATGNFFLKGGIGVSNVYLSQVGPDGSGSGFGTVMGVGYDWRLGRKVSLTPQFTVFGGRTGDVEDDDGNPIRNDVKFGMATLSIGVTWH